MTKISVVFFEFLIIKTLDLHPDSDSDSLEMLDPDPGFNESGSTTLLVRKNNTLVRMVGQ
jgi:hypothetical protein